MGTASLEVAASSLSTWFLLVDPPSFIIQKVHLYNIKSAEIILQPICRLFLG